jgi:hypothetical protein
MILKWARVPGLSSYAASDNLLYYPTQPIDSFGGISFSTDKGGDFNLFYGPPNALLSSLLNPGGYFPGYAFTPIDLQISQVAATPLPTAWSMMLIGIAGFGVMAFRRKAKPGLMAA